jgi:hypothetical protein
LSRRQCFGELLLENQRWRFAANLPLSRVWRLLNTERVVRKSHKKQLQRVEGIELCGAVGTVLFSHEGKIFAGDAAAIIGDRKTPRSEVQAVTTTKKMKGNSVQREKAFIVAWFKLDGHSCSVGIDAVENEFFDGLWEGRNDVRAANQVGELTGKTFDAHFEREKKKGVEEELWRKDSFFCFFVLVCLFVRSLDNGQLNCNETIFRKSGETEQQLLQPLCCTKRRLKLSFG